MPIKDSLIAASALTHGLAIATRDKRDFAATGLEIVDPFATPKTDPTTENPQPPTQSRL